jgi:hypothetical protein
MTQPDLKQNKFRVVSRTISRGLAIRTPKVLCTFVLCFVWFSVPVIVRAATLFLMPQSGEIFKGDSFITELMIDTEGEEINAADIRVVFPSDLVTVNDFEKGGSIFSLWAEEPNIKEGEITFSAGVPGGFSGKGLIGRINFSGKDIGETEINFKEDSKVLLNDGKGSLVILGFSEGNYNIVEKSGDLPIITSKSHPDQNKWYNQKNLNLWWDLAKGAEYSYLLSLSFSDSPDEIPDKPEGELDKSLDEGIYYFSLRQKLPGKDWSGKVTFRAMIDTTPPEEFKPEIAEIEGKKYLVFSTTDKISGVDHYEIAIPSKGPLFGLVSELVQWKTGNSPYLLEDKTLDEKIFVKAIDKAENEQISEIILPSKPFPYYILILALIILVIFWLIVRKIKKNKTKKGKQNS